MAVRDVAPHFALLRDADLVGFNLRRVLVTTRFFNAVVLVHSMLKIEESRVRERERVSKLRSKVVMVLDERWTKSRDME